MNGRKNGVVLTTAVLLCMALLMCILAGCSTLHAGERDSQSTRLLVRVWPHTPPLESVLSKQDQEYAEAALAQWLEAYLHREYEIVDRKFFWTEPDSSEWGPLRQAYANRMMTEWSGTVIDPPWREPGYDLATVWKLQIDGEAHYFAQAMTDQPVPGTRGRQLGGHFQLRKVED